MRLIEPLARWHVLDEVFSDGARIAAMLAFESALARAEARVGVIPQAAADAIGRQCAARSFDHAALARDAARAGNVAIPLVDRLRERLTETDSAAAPYVHWGATSQDVLDTSLVLLLRTALERVDEEMQHLAEVLAGLTERHRATLTVGRTLMQQAAPTTFGLKAAGWLDAVTRHRERLKELRPRLIVLQFGGAVGNLAALGDRGLDVAQALGAELRLPVPDIPWHAQRDRLADTAAFAAIGTGILAKIARDLSLLGQTEVGEVSEPFTPGRGSSSTMPQKRNPVAAATVLAAASRAPGLLAAMLAAMPQEGERGLGGLLVDWETLPELVALYGGALHHLTRAVAELDIDAPRMRANLEASLGLVFAEAVRVGLTAKLGTAAVGLVVAACNRARAEKRHLHDVLADDPALKDQVTGDELRALFDPLRSLGTGSRFIDRVLSRRAKD
jgi:3-carboxy-cis,cis-muconate cycloisomerase